VLACSYLYNNGVYPGTPRILLYTGITMLDSSCNIAMSAGLELHFFCPQCVDTCNYFRVDQW